FLNRQLSRNNTGFLASSSWREGGISNLTWAEFDYDYENADLSSCKEEDLFCEGGVRQQETE
ncbi:unnamed protein product, partial [Linum tenue]